MSNGVVSIVFPAAPKSAAARFAAHHFLAGPENALAAAAVFNLQHFDFSQSRRFNPLLIYGPPASGKSHLARGLARQAATQLQPADVVVLQAGDFAQDYAAAIELEEVASWREQMRRVRLLVMEDLESLAKKPPAQQEFVATLDCLLADEAQVIVTARAPARQLTSLCPRLRSRLMSGLELPLALPAAATRWELLRQFAQLRQLQLADEAASSLVASSATAAELLGMLTALELAARGTSRQIDLAAVRQHLPPRDQAPPASLRAIALATARVHGLQLADLKSASRERPLVTARCVAMLLARQLTGKGLAQIGRYFGNRDHTTVLHACRRAEELMQTDPVVRNIVNQVRSSFTPAM